MKFPSLTSTLKLLKPFSKKYPSDESFMSSYDRIEEIVSIASFDTSNLDIIVKFYNLNQIQQQLTIVTLIEQNMLETLEKLLGSSYDVNYLIRGRTPLHFAIQEQNMPIIKLLIEYKADLECKDNFKETALNYAVRTGNLKIIKFLLGKGANVNSKASDNTTPLELAINQKDIEIVSMLKKHGAKLGDSFLVRSI